MTHAREGTKKEGALPSFLVDNNRKKLYCKFNKLKGEINASERKAIKR